LSPIQACIVSCDSFRPRRLSPLLSETLLRASSSFSPMRLDLCNVTRTCPRRLSPLLSRPLLRASLRAHVLFSFSPTKLDLCHVTRTSMTDESPAVQVKAACVVVVTSSASHAPGSFTSVENDKKMKPVIASVGRQGFA